MQNYLIKSIIQHYQIILSVFILIVSFCILLFLYNNIYEIQSDIADIYTLKGQLNTAVLDTKNVDYAYNAIENKINHEKTSTIDINSPF